MRYLLLIALVQFSLINFEDASQAIQTMAVPNWSILSQNVVNKGCSYDLQGVCQGFCEDSSECVELMNFNEKVCGCKTCSFNQITKQCNGQCGNIVLESCVSKVAEPKSSSDCACASCNAYFANVVATTQLITSSVINDLYNIPSPVCDDSTCFGNSCTPLFLSINHNRVNESLFCKCGTF